MRCRAARLALLGLLFPGCIHAFQWPFTTQRFKGNSLIGAGSLGLDSDARIIAFGDFNGDQFLDVLTLGKDQQTMTVYVWNHANFAFTKSTTIEHSRRVQNVVPGDFTQDGKLDLLVMSDGSSANQLGMYMYLAEPTGGFNVHPLPIPPSTPVQPIAFDANGDMRIDLLGIPPSSTGSSNSLRVWQNVWNVSDPTSNVFKLVDPNLNGAQCKLSSPHSNAVVDIDGDCLADIFLVCDDGNSDNRHFQIWINNKDAGFTLAQIGRLPKGTQQISFADMDRDGTMDMIFAICASASSSTGVGSDCTLNIAYNQQRPLCSTASSSNPFSPIKRPRPACREPGSLCTADAGFRFDLSARSDNDAYVSIPVSDLLPGTNGQLLVADTTYEPSLPLPIKVGDANLDGFPDLLPIGVDAKSGARTPRLVLSVPCAKGVAGCDGEGKGRRGWEVRKKGAELLESVTDARSVSFWDMDEDGTLDILVQRTGDAGQGSILFVQNNFYYDAFFLRAIVLNGACENGWCPGMNGSARYHPYGVSYSGATFKYTVIDTTGARAAAQVGQLPQTSYHALQTPYSFFGLGRTNNYIENLFVGSTKHTTEHFINMEGVIPNSKVVIIPPTSTTAGAAWRKELYLRPGEWIPWVTVTVVVATVLLAVIVFVLHLNEKRADELERRKASHHINFDAL